MAVNKLPEFAKNGQKNTDGLTLEDGFPVNLKPARQWFNFLFNNLTLAINQIIDDKLNKDANAVSASKLQNSRKIFGQNFDGSADVSGNVTTSTGILLADVNHFIDVGRAGLDRMNFNVYSGVFNFIDTQTGNIVARLNSNGIDCNSATSTKLKDSRKINNVDFDGTKDISITAPMRELTATHPDNALDDGFYICAGVNIAGLYTYGILETRNGNGGNVINQTYTAHLGDAFRVAVRQSWDGGRGFSEWMIVGYKSSTAYKLETARKINTIDFDGTKDISVPTIDAVDNLNSSDTKKPLSANQGRILSEQKLNKDTEQSSYKTDKGFLDKYASRNTPSFFFDSGDGKFFNQFTVGVASSLDSGAYFVLGASPLNNKIKAMSGVRRENGTYDLQKNLTLLDSESNNVVNGDFVWDNHKNGGWARGLVYKAKSDSTTYAGFGAFGSTDTLEKIYMAIGGDNIWSSGNGKGIWIDQNGAYSNCNWTFTGDIQVGGPVYAQKFRSDGDFWFTSKDETTAKRLLTGGLLASNNYLDASKIPELGIYSKGHIYTPSDVCSDTYRGYAGVAKFTGNLDGKLLNARMINGVAFDASYDINIPPVSFYITAGANLNNYQSTGFFFQDADAVAQQIANVPVQSAFALRVERSAGCSQWFTPYNGNGITYFRHYYSGNWSNWIVLKPNLVTLSGQLSGSASFDNSGNVNISASVIQGLGINQTWRNVTSQRAANTTYTNNRAVPIKVAIYLEAGGNNAYANISVGGEFLFAFSNTTAWGTSRGGEITVPPNTTYRVDGTFSKWSELT